MWICREEAPEGEFFSPPQSGLRLFVSNSYDNSFVMNISLKKNEKKALQFFAKRIRRIFGARLVLLKLYGSAVRGERWEESDIDILVLIEKLTQKEKIKVWDEATNINIEFDTLLSPLVMTPEEFNVLRDRERRIALDIEKEGIVYEYKK